MRRRGGGAAELRGQGRKTLTHSATCFYFEIGSSRSRCLKLEIDWTELQLQPVAHLAAETRSHTAAAAAWMNGATHGLPPLTFNFFFQFCFCFFNFFIF